MPIAQLMIAVVSLSYSVVEEVEDTDESTTMCKRRKLDDRYVSIMIRKVMLKMSDRVVLLSSELNKLISAAQNFSLVSFHHVTAYCLH